MTISDERLEEWHAARGRQDRTITISGAKGLAEFDALVSAARTGRAECEAWRRWYENATPANMRKIHKARAATDAARQAEGL